MNTSARTGAVAAVAALVLALPLLLLTMMTGDDETSCPPTTSTTSGGTGALPPGSKAWPMREGTYTFSDYFGTRGGAHQGVDMAAADGTPIYAAADGLVTEAGPASGFGRWIVLSHNLSGHAYTTVYGHMWDDGLVYADGTPVQVGDQVSAGQQIALVGSNGGSTGPHLHFEVWDGAWGTSVIDPLPWLADAVQPGSGRSPATTPAPTVTTTPDTGLAADAATTTSAPPATSTPATTTGCGTTQPGTFGGGDNLAAGSVPAELEPWYRRAGQLCPQISASLLAAQGMQESGFNASAVSSAGAEGVAQFMPGTWPSYGEDSDGNGRISPYDVGDAIMAQGKYMCSAAAAVDGWIADGTVADVPDRRELYLAAYNAGTGAVQRSGGFPTGHSDYQTQTRPYVDKILAYERDFARVMS
ncbi:peptidoglycan DD-metalloendopeptidase family protein [Nocardia sp. NPDC127526]|uniref:peptidoglycan DD-metalloendopeptidase family protein n=1 Tax=Nocardia sp. NPDC127526 TaxID=3345393 RepID=UPI00362738B5